MRMLIYLLSPELSRVILPAAASWGCAGFLGDGTVFLQRRQASNTMK